MSSWWCPRAILLQPSSWAFMKICFRRFHEQRKHGDFRLSVDMSKPVVTTCSFTPCRSQKSSRYFVSLSYLIFSIRMCMACTLMAGLLIRACLPSISTRNSESLPPESPIRILSPSSIKLNSRIAFRKRLCSRAASFCSSVGFGIFD